MIAARSFNGKTVALFGLGGSGIATATALAAGGARVIAWDDNPESVARAGREAIATQDLRGIDWSGVASLVLSPGVPLTHPKPHRTRPRRAVHRDHRHQRQVDHHGADRAHPDPLRP